MRLVIALLGAFLVGCTSSPKCPIKLTIPSGATPAPLPKAAFGFETSMSSDGSAIEEGPEIYSWARGFNSSQAWDSVVKHVETIVLPLGYKPVKAATLQLTANYPGVATESVGREWISPDGKYVASLLNVGQLRSMGAPFEPGEAAYVFGVDQIKELPPLLQEQINADYSALQ